MVSDPNATALDPSVAAEVMEGVLQSLKADINLALGARYFTLMGFILVVYDHIATLRAERRLIWSAPPSLVKYGFLLNRYLVPISLLVGFIPLSGFNGMDFSDLNCRVVVPIVAMLMVCSLALGNGLVALRVAALWEYEKSKSLLMLCAFVLSYVSTFVAFLIAILQRYTYIVWSPLLNMCVLGRSSSLLTVSWASSLGFETLVLGVTCWNAVDRPREANTPLLRTLQKDGIIFFAVMTLLRVFQLSLVATQNPGLVLLTSFFVWGLVTITLHRSLLSFRRAELAAPRTPTSMVGRRGGSAPSPLPVRTDTAKSKETVRSSKSGDWGLRTIEVEREVEWSDA